MNLYDLVRGLHILAVIAWMAGLLYLPRLFVYHTKHHTESAVVEVFRVMERNLLRLIMNPAMIATWVLGVGLVYLNIHDRYGWRFLWMPWVMVKLFGVVLLTGYHHFLALRFKTLMRGEDAGSEVFWRRINEVPFVLAIIMVLAVSLEFGGH
jgi:protoporphyrinogen IX oxidase